MRIGTGLALVAVAGVTAGAALAAPPPPALPPKVLEQPVLGYDLRPLFELWRYRVEAQKGEVADALLATREPIEGEQAIGAPILEFRKSNDFGHFMTGEIRVYCKPLQPHGFDRASCHYRLRRAYVEPDAATYGQDNPVSRWTRESFDGQKVAERIQALGLPPKTDWWMLPEREALFSTLPSAAPILTANATVVTLDSRECPAFAQAIEALEGRRLDWRVDLLAVGRDQAFDPPWPHAVSVEFTIRSTESGRQVSISGSGKGLQALAGPILDTADVCEARRGG